MFWRLWEQLLARRIPSSNFSSQPAEIENVTEIKGVSSSGFMISGEWRLSWSRSVFSSNLVRNQRWFGHEVSQVRYYLLVSGDWKHSWSRVSPAHGFFLDQRRLKPWLGTKCFKPNIISWSVNIENTVGHKVFPVQAFFLNQRRLKTWLKQRVPSSSFSSQSMKTEHVVGHKESRAQVLAFDQWEWRFNWA